MIDLWIIRHGETFENVNTICQGQNPGTLTKKGVLQAEAVGKMLKNEEFDYFYSSDLKRTMLSMEKVIQYHPSNKIIAEPLLRERYLAAWQGKPFPKGWKNLKPPQGAETVDDLMERASAFVHHLKEKHQREKVVVMSHGGLIRALWTLLSKPHGMKYYQWEAPLNTSVTRIQLHEKKENKILFLNQVAHLDGNQGILNSENHTKWQL